MCIRDRAYAELRHKLMRYEDSGLEPEDIKKHEAAYNECLTRTYGPFKQKISQWLQAEQDGRLVVLPFVQHSTMINLSDPENPELMKDVRLSVSWTSSSNIVFHCPYNCFWQDIEKGYVKPVSKETEEALAGKGGDG